MNSDNFKAFKPYADSTLMSMTKIELINYIHALLNNWQATDEQLCNVIKYNYRLNKALKGADENENQNYKKSF